MSINSTIPPEFSLSLACYAVGGLEAGYLQNQAAAGQVAYYLERGKRREHKAR